MLTDTGANDIFLYNTGQITSISDATWNRKQFYSVTRVDRRGSHLLATDLPCPPCNVGKNSIPSYAPLTAEAIHSLGNGSRVFAGQRADEFYVDLGSIFDLGDLRPFQPDFLIKGLSAMPGINTLAGLNVHSIEIQVPIRDLTSARHEAEELQGGRLDHRRLDDGEPPEGLHRRLWRLPCRAVGPGVPPGHAPHQRGHHPDGPEGLLEHPGASGGRSVRPLLHHPALASLLNVLYPGAFPEIAAYTAKPSNTRPDLDAILLTGVPAGLFAGFQNYTGATKADLLRLNVAIPPTAPASANILGVVGGDNAGFPNGRRVFDDVVSVELKAVAGALLHDVVPSFTRRCRRGRTVRCRRPGHRADDHRGPGQRRSQLPHLVPLPRRPVGRA